MPRREMPSHVFDEKGVFWRVWHRANRTVNLLSVHGVEREYSELHFLDRLRQGTYSTGNSKNRTRGETA